MWDAFRGTQAPSTSSLLHATTSPWKDAPSISHGPPTLSASRNTKPALSGSKSKEGAGLRHKRDRC